MTAPLFAYNRQGGPFFDGKNNIKPDCRTTNIKNKNRKGLLKQMTVKLSEAARAARAEYKKQYREANKDRIAAYQKQWHEANPGKKTEYERNHWERVAANMAEDGRSEGLLP